MAEFVESHPRIYHDQQEALQADYCYLQVLRSIYEDRKCEESRTFVIHLKYVESRPRVGDSVNLRHS